MREIKVAFCSGARELWEEYAARMREVRPDLPLVVVSEFPVAGAEWLPWHVGRTYAENIAKLDWHFRESRAVLCAMILQPRQPVWSMRRAAWRFGGVRTLFFNENLGHFMLRPRSAGVMARHAAWRLKSFLRRELNPGGTAYTSLWRLWHPEAWRRPWMARKALRLAAREAKGRTMVRPDAASPQKKPRGVSVVIPTRDGRELLARLFESLWTELEAWPHEVIVVDNGSGDGTAAWLRQERPAAIVEESAAALSFARAVNRGIARARYSHVLLLNNDMTLEPGFLAPLFEAFARVPELFCATAQILFPEGVRREETGKAAWCARRGKEDFFLRCDEPLAGEDHTYVLYGSGGCSLLDAAKLEALGGLGEQFVPAYVEDLDLGWRAWQRGWPSVFVAGARVVHRHRATTARFYTPRQLDVAVQVNFLRWIWDSVAAPEVLLRLWGDAIGRLNQLAARHVPDEVAMETLRWASSLRPGAKRMPCVADESRVLALGAGEHAVFPGRKNEGRARVLVVSPYAPFPLSHGGAVRMYNLMREAARRFDQVLVYFADELAPPPPEVLELCAEAVVVRREGTHARPLTERPDVVEEFDSPVMRALLGEMVRKWRPGVAQLEFTQMAQYAPECAPAAAVLVEHDVTLDLYGQLLREREDWETRAQWERWKRFEREAWGRMARVVVMSDKDARMVDDAGRTVVLANGVDLERYAPGSGEPEARRLLFIGSFAHLPNVMALDWFLREAWPRLEGYTLHVIAGKDPRYFLERYRDRVQPPLDQPGIEVEAFVSDPRPAYRRASVVIAPLLASAGTNIKIMEAMAMGKAVVSTPGGMNGLDDLCACAAVEETGRGFAEAILRLEETGARRAMERAGREMVSALYGWRAIGEKQREMYQSLMPRQA